MGVDLIIKYKGKFVACPGRAYHYHTEGKVERDLDKVVSDINETTKFTIDRMIARVAYSPTNEEELDSITQNTREEIEGLAELLLEAGEKLLLAKLLEEDDITIEEA